MADYWGDPDFSQMAVAAVVAVLLAYSLSWAMDKAFMRRLVRDRVACIAYGCTFVFLLLMGGATLLLTWTSPFVEGPIIIPAVGYAISFLLGTAIAGALRMAVYSHYEGNLDEEIVFDPDYSDPALYDHEVLAWDEQNSGSNYLRRHWVGHLPLPVSYWVNGALLSALILAAAELLTYKIKTNWGSLRGVAIVALAYLIVSLIVWVWSSVGIWRSAYWHRRRGGSAGWGLAARGLVVIGAILTIFRSENIALQAAEFGHLAVGRDAIGPIAEMKVSPDGRALLVHGNLSEGSADRFDTVLAAAPRVKEVVLTSPGGRILEAERIADAIHRRSLDTRVIDLCMSACTNLLLAGRERSAPEGAKIGFHQPAFPGWSDAELGRAVEASRAEYLAAGVDGDFILRALATPASSIWVPSQEELLAAHVLTRAAIQLAYADGAPADAPASWIVRSANDLARYHELEADTARINATAPIQLGPLVTLDRAAVNGTMFTHFYTLRLPALSAADKAKLASLSRRQSCSDPAMLQTFRAGVGLVDIYRDTGGRTLLTIKVSDCPGG